MKPHMITSFNSKFLRPCKKHLTKLLRIPSFKFLSRKRKRRATRRRFRFGFRFDYLRAALGLRRVDADDIQTLGEMKSFSDPCCAPYPSPLTPAYVKLVAAAVREFEEVEEACRSFESYLVEMMVEEGDVRDLKDVEELLCGWGGLKSPVFIELVSSFYRELCRDLFSG